ncbi:MULTISPECIES: preprotein translocase subunit SecG [Anaerococcus]|uniref:Protein-export membrane protein SecG n=3 Tax=Anaerococcus hydrogenalis TaxID=33029 RepID=F0GZN4_9FIRM|nr:MULTISPECIES: preprotein translocase subunit SecG [Anaerococcus]MDU6063714.1 preprotein translocase subunit SecG [Anaerococcus sp.]EGC84585.1 preprotein translocase, SecG subunit [Anaerococcus hydrogenalis ACS-025-V-Sch4]MBS5988333.1 preprotein translocase subunit SecG [Anaerococcus hydrogenalis]MDK7694608.1 preprotein translocase subunit SecG [Anaerococcus hydrogenalis]MDK7696386.1 preprotein translocase subunit SecG [Anaerococcus hydrogenalis]
MTTVLSVLLMIASVVLVIAVTLQEPKTDGLGTLAGQETNVFGRSAHRSKNEMLDKVVIFAGVVLFLLSTILLAIS